MRVGLIGCVKSKLPYPASADELYVSPLFRGRRAFVERTCDRWFILSAKHGLVDPRRILAPYDRTLNKANDEERRIWGEGVLLSLEGALGELTGHVFEVHAGAAYLENGLVEGLTARGASVENPVIGLSLGQQLAFYKEANLRSAN